MTTRYEYLPRAAYGSFKGTPPPEAMPDPEEYVHHTGGAAWMGGTVAPGYDASRNAAIAVARGLNIYAQNVKKYQFLDYDDLVWYDRFNDICWIIEGRSGYRSAATLDRNEQGEATCACGNYELREPLAPELEGIARAIAKAVNEGRLARNAVIYGHRDNPAHPNATRCPGKHLYAKLPVIRARVAELLTPPTPPPAPSPTPTLEGGIDMAAAIAHEAGKDTFWYTPNGLRRYPVTSMDHVSTLLNMGAVDAVTGTKLTSTNWAGASVLSVAQLNSRLGQEG